MPYLPSSLLQSVHPACLQWRSTFAQRYKYLFRVPQFLIVWISKLPLCLVYQSLVNFVRIKELPEFPCPGTVAAEGQTLLLARQSRAACQLPSKATPWVHHTSFFPTSTNITDVLFLCAFFQGAWFCLLVFSPFTLWKETVDNYSWVLTFFPPADWQTNLKILYQLQIFWTNQKAL